MSSTLSHDDLHHFTLQKFLYIAALMHLVSHVTAEASNSDEAGDWGCDWDGGAAVANGSQKTLAGDTRPLPSRSPTTGSIFSPPSSSSPQSAPPGEVLVVYRTLLPNCSPRLEEGPLLSLILPLVPFSLSSDLLHPGISTVEVKFDRVGGTLEVIYMTIRIVARMGSKEEYFC
eukprot:scaffold284375_cov71-Attheya_sp.AAC.2